MSKILEIKDKLKSVFPHTGREDFVFSPQEGLDGLFNIHKALIKKTLNNEHTIKYLLYSPIYYAEPAPSRVKSKPSSCTLLATENKFIITKNYHSDKIFPQVYLIDFRDICSLEMGWAGLMGWLRVEFVCEEKLKDVSVIYGINSGMEHFSNLVKVYIRQLNTYFNGRSSKVTFKEGIPFCFVDIGVFLKIKKMPVWVKKKIFRGVREILLCGTKTIFAGKKGVIVAENKKDYLLEAGIFLFIPYSSIFGFRINDFTVSGGNFLKMTIYLRKNLSSYTLIFDKKRQSKEALTLESLFKKILSIKGKNTYARI